MRIDVDPARNNAAPDLRSKASQEEPADSGSDLVTRRGQGM
jgi:hypothetical protein